MSLWPILSLPIRIQRSHGSGNAGNRSPPLHWMKTLTAIVFHIGTCCDLCYQHSSFFFRTLSLSVKLQNWHFTLPDPLKYMKSLMTLKSKSYSTSKETKKSLQSSDHIGRGSAPPRSLSQPPALSGSSRTASLTRYFLQEATIQF